MNTTQNQLRRKCLCPPSQVSCSHMPFRRRVSFSDAVIEGDHCYRNMQSDITKSSHDDDRLDTERQNDLYDIWKADDSASRSDDGYENTVKIDNYTEKHILGYTSNNDQNLSENIDEIVENQKSTTEKCKSKICPVSGIIENKAKDIGEEYMLSSEAVLKHDSVKPIEHNEYRMRGGCSGCCRIPRENSQNHDCENSPCCGQLANINELCPVARPYHEDVKTACTAIATCIPSRCCLKKCRIVRKKTIRCTPVCTINARGSCDSDGCCKSGCRGGCSQTCMLSRACTSPVCRPDSSRGRSFCAQACCSQLSCPPIDSFCRCSSSCRDCCVGNDECKSLQSPRCQTIVSGGNCINDRTKCSVNGAAISCCRLKLPTACECFGGGPDCQRCGRKVYQAEMQIASGIPYHSICFSCFCCRKPLEPLTYQENCGEIYCKQCYIRNFGPQGYGYGIGAGALQTPL